MRTVEALKRRNDELKLDQEVHSLNGAFGRLV